MQNVRLLSLCFVTSAVILLVSNWPVNAALGEPPPTVFLERSAIVGVGRSIHVTRVPTQDITGAVRYFDLEVTLNVNELGIVDAAAVISAESPQFLTSELIAGDYQDAEGGQCTLTIGTALEGRKAVVLNCVDNGSRTLSASLYSGPITGHLFELELLTAGIEQIPGHENLTWGKVIDSPSAFTYFFTNHIIGVNQVGGIVTVTNYGGDNIVNCGHNFTQVGP